MDKIKREKIHSLAERIHNELKLDIPVDLQIVIRKLKGELKEDSYDDLVDAKIEKVGDTFKISVNDKKPKLRNNFSIAHELGHLFLHMGYLINPAKWQKVQMYTDSVYYRFGHDSEELEANEFAAAFLMPETKYRKVVKEYSKNNLCDISKIAERFGVSEEAALNRGRWLKIFSWK